MNATTQSAPRWLIAAMAMALATCGAIAAPAVGHPAPEQRQGAKADGGSGSVHDNRPSNSTSESWRPRQPSEIARTEVSAAAVGRYVYVIGGYAIGGSSTRAVERYDTRRDRWRRVQEMPVAVNHATAVSYRGNLYVLGGYTGAPFSLGIGTGNLGIDIGTGSGTGGVADATSAFFRYDPERDEWSQMPSAPTARAAMAATVIGHRLYVAGGGDSLRALTTFETFDFRRGRWRSGPSMPLATEHTAGTAAGGDFYVVSGRPNYGAGTNSFVQRYRPRTKRWRRVADVSHGRGGFAAVTVCDRVVIFGGEDPGRGPPGTVPEVERYHPSSDVWRSLPSMRTPRHGLGGVAVGDRLYALEGGDVTLLSITQTNESLDVACGRRGADKPARGADKPAGNAGKPARRGFSHRRG